MGELRWEKQSQGGYWAYSGEVVMAMIGQRIDGTFYYSLDGVRTKWITKGHGEVGSLTQAKRSVERAWREWLKATGLDEGGR